MLHPDLAGLGLADSRPAQCNLLSLPNELLLEIAEHLLSPAANGNITFRDTGAFLRVNHRLHQLLTPCFLRRAISDFFWGPPGLCRSILHWAAAHQGSPSPLRKLLLYGRSELINEVDYDGISPLVVAVLYNNTTTTQFLLEEGADTDMYSDEEITAPLIYAVAFGYHDIVELLLNAGADTETVNCYRCTPLHIIPIIESATSASIIKKALIRAGANTGARDMFGYTPTQFEVMWSHLVFGKEFRDPSWSMPLSLLRVLLESLKATQHMFRCLD